MYLEKAGFWVAKFIWGSFGIGCTRDICSELLRFAHAGVYPFEPCNYRRSNGSWASWRGDVTRIKNNFILMLDVALKNMIH